MPCCAATAPRSVLAHNFVWLTDEPFAAAFFARVAPHLPPELAGAPTSAPGPRPPARLRIAAHRCAAGAGPPLCVRTACGAGATLAGLNARWRLYRYVPGAHYRPHVDGAWPGRYGAEQAAWATRALATTQRVNSQQRNA